jgi:hypothetical protein
MEEFKAKKNFIWCSLIVYTEPANFQYTNILFFVYLYSEIHGSFPCRAICVLLFCLKDDIRDHIRYYYQRCRPLKLATWVRICKCLWSPGIDSQESISPAYVAWRASTINTVGFRTGPPIWESIPGLLKRSTNTGSGSSGNNAVAAHVHNSQVHTF